MNLANSDIDVNFYKNQKLPDINLLASFGLNSPDDDRYVYDKVFSGDYYTAKVGIDIQYPWKLRADRARYASARYNQKTEEINRTKTKENVILDIRTAIRNLQAGEKRFQSSLASMNLAKKKLTAEDDKFRQGLSTSYTVLQFQRDLTDEAVKHVNAIIDYQRARVQLYKANGTTLERHNIEVQKLAE